MVVVSYSCKIITAESSTHTYAQFETANLHAGMFLGTRKSVQIYTSGVQDQTLLIK